MEKKFLTIEENTVQLVRDAVLWANENGGRSYKELAEMLGCSDSHVRRIIIKYKIPYTKPLTQDQIKELNRKEEDIETLKIICDRYDMGYPDFTKMKLPSKQNKLSKPASVSMQESLGDVKPSSVKVDNIFNNKVKP